MKHLATSAVVILTLAACGEPTSPPAATADRAEGEHGAGSAYKVVDLGNLGGPRTFPLRVNGRGQVAGNGSLADGSTRAFVWDARHGMRNLGTLGGSYSTVGGMNDDGTIVGCSGDATDTQRAFIWTEEDGMKDIGTLGGPYACAQGITEEGEVVGYSTLTTGGKEHGFTWSRRHGMRDAGQLNGTNTELRAVSKSGRFGAGVGNLFAGGHAHAVLWNARTGYTDIGTLGHDPSQGLGVNDRAQVIGNSRTASLGGHGFYWDASGGMVDLVPLDGPDGFSGAAAINEHGVVVGATSTPDDIRGFTWTKRGGMKRLYGLPGEVFGHADGINDDGWVVGTSEPGDGLIHGVLWMPKDE